MRIIRRGARLDDGGYHELQEFECRICYHNVERKVATDGTLRLEVAVTSCDDAISNSEEAAQI